MVRPANSIPSTRTTPGFLRRLGEMFISFKANGCLRKNEEGGKITSLMRMDRVAKKEDHGES